jgi:uncharacterized protein YcfL
MKIRTLGLVVAAVLTAATAQAQTTQYTGTPISVASKLAIRGEMHGVEVPEMRVVRKNDILVVQADLINNDANDRVLFYRFRWLDANGNQVGDGEAWKQMGLLGRGMQTVKSVAPTFAATDFRLEMNISHD